MRSGLEDQDNLFRAIGAVVVAFQRTELALTEQLGRLLGMRREEEQRILGAAMSFGQKVDLFAALHRKSANSTKEELCGVACNYLKAAEEFRNNVVHSDYYVVGRTVIRWVQQKASVRGSKGLRLRKKIVNIPYIVDGAKTIMSLWFEATCFDLVEPKDSDLRAKLQAATVKLQQRPASYKKP